MTLHPLLRSSADPEKLSLTIKGILTGLVTLLTVVGVIPAEAVAEISPLTDIIVQAVQTIAGAISVCMILFGALRKIYMQYFADKE